MGRKDIERLEGNIQLMHLALIGSVSHLYHIQQTLYQRGGTSLGVAIILSQDRGLAVKMAARPTHLAITKNIIVLYFNFNYYSTSLFYILNSYYLFYSSFITHLLRLISLILE